VWSAGAQHRDYLNTVHRNEKPKEAFWQDLKKFLRHWKTEGEYIILVIDFKDDVKSQERINFFNDLDMSQINLEQHGMALPRTQKRGQIPIDGVYLSLDLDVSMCGYLRFGKGLPIDDRLLSRQASILGSVHGLGLPHFL
jgi:hypothetical protein